MLFLHILLKNLKHQQLFYREKNGAIRLLKHHQPIYFCVLKVFLKKIKFFYFKLIFFLVFSDLYGCF
jgi:hypothetical protein